jgi:hypothetical protein
VSNTPYADDDGYDHPSAWDMGKPDSYHKLAKSISDGFGDGTGDLFSMDDVPSTYDDFAGSDNFGGSVPKFNADDEIPADDGSVGNDG